MGHLDEEVATRILVPLLDELKSKRRIEPNEETEDPRLAHLINLISVVFKRCPESKNQLVDKELFDFVLKD